MAEQSFNVNRSGDTQSPSELDLLLSMSKRFAESLHFKNPEEAWATVVEEISKLFQSELTSLFLVDEADSNFISLKAQSPGKIQTLKLRIESYQGGGLTAHAAATASAFILNEVEIAKSQFVRNLKSDYIPSGSCYSVLFAPLKNRKDDFVGLIRLVNKGADPKQRHSFNADDLSKLLLLTGHIALLLESTFGLASLLSLVEKLQRVEGTEEAVSEIAKVSRRNLRADSAVVSLWNRELKSLVVAGSDSKEGYSIPESGTRVTSDFCCFQLWENSVRSSSDRTMDCSHETRIDGSPGAKSTVAVVLRIHGQPAGILYLESSREEYFDERDAKILEELSRHISIGIQAMAPLASTKDTAGFLGAAGVLFGEAERVDQPFARHIPLDMWRKDIKGSFLWVTDQFCRTIGKTQKEIIGKKDTELFSEDFAKRFENGDSIALKQGYFDDPWEAIPLPTGETRYIHVIKRPFYDLLGNIAGTQGLFLDVTGYAHIFHRAPIGFMELAADGRIRRVNKAACEALEATIEDLVGKLLCDIADDKKLVSEIAEKQLNKQDEEEFDWHPINLTVGGRPVPFAIEGKRLQDSSGKKMGALCVVRKISTGSAIEEAIQEQDPWFLNRIKDFVIPVFCVDDKLRFTYANQALLKRDGFSSLEEILGKTGIEVYGELGKGYHKDSSHVFSSEKVLDKIEHHDDATSNREIVRVLKFPIRDSQGRVTGVLGVFWDYKNEEFAKKLLRDALRETKRVYRQIVEHTSEGVFLSTLEGRFIQANPAMIQLLGCSNEEDLLTWENAGTERFAEQNIRVGYLAKVRAAKQDVPLQFEYLLRKRDGTTIWVAETVQKGTGVDGSTDQIVGFAEDITERRNNREKIEKSLREKEDLLTMLSHQLRSPVWQAFSRADDLVQQLDPHGTLANGTASAEVRRIATIRGLARKTRAVAWSLAMMSKLSGMDGVNLGGARPISPRSLIKMAREAARDVQLIRRASSARFLMQVANSSVPDFTIEVDDSMASTRRIHGDPDLIEQCVSNVVENSFKYSRPTSTIMIHCVIQNRFATLTVKNRPLPGLEIDEYVAVRCKEKEWRSPGAAASDADGTGLGLWFVDRVMQAHKGQLLVQVTDADGWNCFGLRFPLL
jgi:PAS domain S-box-containing protein